MGVLVGGSEQKDWAAGVKYEPGLDEEQRLAVRIKRCLCAVKS